MQGVFLVGFKTMVSFISNFKSAFVRSDNQSQSKSSTNQNDQQSDELADEINDTNVSGAGAVAGGVAATLAVLSGLLKPSNAAAQTITFEQPSSSPADADAAESGSRDTDLVPVTNAGRPDSETDVPDGPNDPSKSANFATPQALTDLKPSLAAPASVAPEYFAQDPVDVAPQARTAPQTTSIKESDDTAQDATDANPETAPADSPQIESHPPGQPNVTVSTSVTEAADPTTVIGTIEAAEAGTTFHIVSQDGTIIDHPVFEISGTKIQLKPGVTLDFEQISEIDLSIIASNADGQSVPTQITLTISDEAEVIQLANGGASFIDIGVTETSVTGGTGDDTIIGSVGDDTLAGAAGDDALDGGAGDDMSVFTGNWADYTITQSGDVTTVTDNRAGSPDGTDTLSGIETLRFADGDLAIADALNDAPEITATVGVVAENASGATVGTVTGADAAASDTLTYTVDDARFEIVDGDLKLRDDAALDFEADGGAVNVIVTATDAHGATAHETVTLTISDEAEVIQLADGGATFTDTGVTETSVTGGDGSDNILGSTGNDTLAGAAGADTLTGGDGSDTAVWDGDFAGFAVSYDGDTDTFTIIDQNAGDADEGTDTVTGVETFTFNGISYTAIEMQTEAARQANTAPENASVASGGSVVENSADGTVVATLTATDVDGDALSYTITDAAGNPVSDSNFEIVGNEIRVKPVADLDFEDAQSHDIYVTASDEFETSAPQQITVTVDDVAEDIQLADGGASFVESDTTETSVTGGTGGDSINGGDGDDLINGGDGNDHLRGEGGTDTAVWDGDLSDFDVSYDPSSGFFTITDQSAGDGDEGQDVVSLVEVFTFNGVNYTADEMQTEAARQANTAPEAPTVASGGTIAENSAAGTVVATLTATDADGDALSYQITDANGDPTSDNNFEIVGNEIQVKLGADIDFETAESHDLYVTASDDFETSAPQQITLTVSDEAEVIQLDESGGTFTDTGVTEISVTGGDGLDTIIGGAGNDTLAGGRHHDNIQGGAGDDTIYGDRGFDTILGGAGDDTIFGGKGHDNLSGGDGDDFLSGDVGDDTFVGGAGDDTIVGGGGSDIAAWDGDFADFAVSYDSDTSTFTITDQNTGDADEGTDTATGVETFTFNGISYTAAEMQTEAARQANTGPGAASVASGGSIAENSAEGTVVATLTATDVDGDTLSYTITDAAGNPVTDSKFEIVGNEIRVKPGADIDFETTESHDLYVTASDDFETSAPQQITLTVGDEAEVIQLDDGGVTFTDTGVTETSVTGGDGDDNITGSAGNDTLAGAAGDDTLTGGDGHDELRGWSGHDTLIGGAGDDTLFGASNEDTLQGDAGNDDLDGGTGDDMLSGGADDDWLTGGTHDDTLDGGDGSDTAVWDGDFADFAVSYDSDIDTFVITDENAGDADEGTDTVTGVETFSFNGVEYSAADLQTEAARQANTAPDAASVASGGSIAENSADGAVVATLTATDVDGDTLSYTITDAVGNPVSDSNFEIVDNEIRVKPGADIDFETAESHDLYVTASDGFETSAPTQITLTLTDEAEVIQLGDGGVTFTDTGVTETSVIGGDGDDIITGTDGRDNIQGGAGNDTISSGRAGDVIDGGEGSDTILLDDLNSGQTNIITDSGTAGTDRIVLSTGAGSYRIQGDFSASSGIEIIDGSDATGDWLGTMDESANFDFTDVTLVGVGEIAGTGADDSIIGSAGNDTITMKAGDDTVAGGAGDDTLDGGDGSDTFQVAVMEGHDTVVGGNDGGWTDVIDLQGMGSGALVSDDTVDGAGWTMILDSGSTVTGQSGDILDLSTDAAGVITFDDGGTVDFAGIERITW